jgi:tRNA (guanine-N7-)-methyltransferase
MVKKRPRHHANPFAFIQEVQPPDWRQAFAHPDRPMEVDIGCDKGDFLFGRARQAPERNLVGLELRETVAAILRDRIARSGLDNVAVVHCNANLSFEALFAPGSLARVYVHFPDPWFKTRHRKRRIVNQALLDAIASRLEPGGAFEFMTDQQGYAEEAVPLVEAHPAFENLHGPAQPATPEPERVLSHREEWHLSRGDPVHRYRWRRRD